MSAKGDSHSQELAPSQAAHRIRSMVLAALLAALTGASSLVAIPIGPVPITLQSLFVLASGGILGPKWGALSMCLYLAMGVAGLPVFAGGTSGFGKLLGPTGGYLVGFVLASATVGSLTKSSSRLPWIFFSSLVGLSVIYSLGCGWLSLIAKIPLKKAIMVGLLPFVPGDLLKAFLASLLVVKWQAVQTDR
jgi:biotin transport system substrate-specific component